MDIFLLFYSKMKIFKMQIKSSKCRQNLDANIHCLANKAGQKLYEAISRKKRYPLQDLYHKVVFEFGIKPFVKRKGESYNGVIAKWKGMEI